MEKRNYIVAIDPGSSSITIAVGSQGEDGKLILTDITSKQMQGITRGEITNRQDVSSSVREVCRMSNRGSAYAFRMSAQEYRDDT
jgi:cell division ATPase FtsA